MNESNFKNENVRAETGRQACRRVSAFHCSVDTAEESIPWALPPFIHFPLAIHRFPYSLSIPASADGPFFDGGRDTPEAKSKRENKRLTVEVMWTVSICLRHAQTRRQN